MKEIKSVDEVKIELIRLQRIMSMFREDIEWLKKNRVEIEGRINNEILLESEYVQGFYRRFVYMLANSGEIINMLDFFGKTFEIPGFEDYMEGKLKEEVKKVEVKEIIREQQSARSQYVLPADGDLTPEQMQLAKEILKDKVRTLLSETKKPKEWAKFKLVASAHWSSCTRMLQTRGLHRKGNTAELWTFFIKLYRDYFDSIIMENKDLKQSVIKEELIGSKNEGILGSKDG